MNISVGIAVIYENKLLLAHPTNSAWKNTFSIPKGLIEPNEDYLECGLRELYEETGFKLDSSTIDDKNPIEIQYIKKNVIVKKVFYFIARITELPPIFDGLKIKLEHLQLDEVDHCQFYSLEEAEPLIFWRQKSILNLLK